MSIEGGYHGGRHRGPPGRIYITIRVNSIRNMIAVQPNQSDIPLVEQGEADTAMAEAMTEEASLVEAHLTDPLTKPPIKLILHKGREGSITVRELKHEVVWTGGTEPHVTEAVKGGDRAADRPGSGDEADLMQALPMLDGLGEEDREDDGVALFEHEFRKIQNVE